MTHWRSKQRMVPTELPRRYSRGEAQGCMWGSLHGVHSTLPGGLGTLHGLPVGEGVISLTASSEASLNHTMAPQKTGSM